MIKHIKLGKSKGAGSNQGFALGGGEKQTIQDSVNKKKTVT